MKTHASAGFIPLLLSLAACSGGLSDAPETRRVDVVDEIHGESIPDPYRWLEEQDSAETRAWIDAQNAYAERVIGESPRRARLRERLSQLMRSPEIGPPQKGGDHEYFTVRRAHDELEIVFRRPAPPEGELVRMDPDGQNEVVIDPHPMSADLTTKVEILSVSSDGKLLLYSLRDGGEDEIEVRVRDVESGKDLEDRLPRALYAGVAFGRKDAGFYYTHRSRAEGPRVRFHVLGDPLEKDETIFGEGYDPTSFVNAREVADGKYLVLTVNHGWARSELHLQDLGTGAPARPLAKDVDARFEPQFHEGLLYVRTNLEASNNRVLAIDPAKPERESWKEVLPESSDVLTDFAFLDGKIYASYLHEVSSRIRVFALDGTPSGELAVPEHHSAQIRGAVEGKAFLELSSFHRPPITYLVDLESGERELWQERELEIDADALVVEQVRYRSADGTEVPMYLFYREGLRRNGDTPTLLFGYGGFNVALTPRFDPMALVWVEHGGLYAMANLRGGSEYGEKWHRDGMLENKQNVLDDFIAAAEFLIDEGYTAPDKLAIRGTSNGGLLVASAMTQRPDLYRAVLCGFPDLDMVRFYTFTRTNNLPALLEYGDASVPEQFAFIKKYSPYQAVREEAAYPAVMLTSGDRDTRVPPLQARKMTARLQHATSSGRPVILKYHPKAGHAASRGLPVSNNIEDTAAELEFLMGQLGVTP
ncbi:MAG TPA: prolyl oligopeptidase family serine peptidase [Vicinamibacteria bacterium]|nr:prolyl oligopeptidase family serine peptidase [Vicinamibacteria bacterium]